MRKSVLTLLALLAGLCGTGSAAQQFGNPGSTQSKTMPAGNYGGSSFNKASAANVQINTTAEGRTQIITRTPQAFVEQIKNAIVSAGGTITREAQAFLDKVAKMDSEKPNLAQMAFDAPKAIPILDYFHTGGSQTTATISHRDIILQE